jgi:myo-inositol-1(or 4)-monophosphatase
VAKPSSTLPISIEAVTALVRRAGGVAMEDFRLGEATASAQWDKDDKSPVSAADLAVDALLRDALCALLPESGWLSEETADSADRLSREYVWIVDPIDGTRDYIRGRAGWAVSVALVCRGEVAAAWLYAPARHEMVVAVAGEGATCNHAPLTASQRTDPTSARFPAVHLPAFARDMEASPCPNSIALRMVEVACGRADVLATVRWGAEWDVAAADLIAREAGAVVTDAHGARLSYNKAEPKAYGVMVTAPALHEEMLARLLAKL